MVGININKKKLIMKYIAMLCLLFSSSAFSAETNMGGAVNNITSIREGLLITLDTGKPSGCPQSSSWMIIKKENTTMISVALAMYMAGNKGATVYVDITSGGSYCEVTQFDPTK